MDIKHFTDEIVKQIPEAKRSRLIMLVERIKSVLVGAPPEFVIPALQLVSLQQLERDPVCDPEADTAVEPVVTPEEEKDTP